MEYEHAHQTVLVGLAISHAETEGERLVSVMGCPCVSPDEALQLLTYAVEKMTSEGLTHDAAVPDDA